MIVKFAQAKTPGENACATLRCKLDARLVVSVEQVFSPARSGWDFPNFASPSETPAPPSFGWSRIRAEIFTWNDSDDTTEATDYRVIGLAQHTNAQSAEPGVAAVMSEHD